MYINEITVKHSAEYFWCQRANKAAFKDVVSSPSTSLLCTSHEVVTQSCLIKIFSPSKSIRFMRSIFILRNNNKHQNHLSDDELNTEKTNSFPRKISRHYKTTQTDESQKIHLDLQAATSVCIGLVYLLNPALRPQGSLTLASNLHALTSSCALSASGSRWRAWRLHPVCKIRSPQDAASMKLHTDKCTDQILEITQRLLILFIGSVLSDSWCFSRI